MKNLLILIVIIALFLHFNPQPEVTKFYDEQKSTLLDGFAKFSDTKVRLKADKIYSDLKPQFTSFSKKEVKALKELTSSRDKVKDFYTVYCLDNKRSTIFHIANQTKVCNTINNYSAML